MLGRLLVRGALCLLVLLVAALAGVAGREAGAPDVAAAGLDAQRAALAR